MSSNEIKPTKLVTKTIDKTSDHYYMGIALKQASLAFSKDEVPIGCIIVKDHQVIALAHNTKVADQQAISHAEINAIKKASKKLGTWILDDCTIYVTLEPCLMCAGAILQSRIKRLVYGASEPKHGAIESVIQVYDPKYQYNHQVIVTKGIRSEESAQLLKNFFKLKRL